MRQEETVAPLISFTNSAYEDPDMKDIIYSHRGLTKREFFAALAMAGSIASCTKEWPKAGFIADNSVEYADALIDALNAPKPSE